MRPTLPRAIGRFSTCALLAVLACRHAESPVAPGEPIPAEPDVTIDTMDKECDGLVAALERYRTCPNNDDEERAWIGATIEVTEQSLAAGKKGSADDKAQSVMARACHKAAKSVDAAHERCNAGPRPRPD